MCAVSTVSTSCQSASTEHSAKHNECWCGQFSACHPCHRTCAAAPQSSHPHTATASVGTLAHCALLCEHWRSGVEMWRLSQSAAFFHCEILVDLEIKFSRAFLLIFEDYFYFDSYIIDIFSEKICSLLRTRPGLARVHSAIVSSAPARACTGTGANVYRLHVMWQFEESV